MHQKIRTIIIQSYYHDYQIMSSFTQITTTMSPCTYHDHRLHHHYYLFTNDYSNDYNLIISHSIKHVIEHVIGH